MTEPRQEHGSSAASAIASEHVQARWDDRRTERTLADLPRRRAGRRRRALAVSMAGSLALAGAVYTLVLWPSAPPAGDSQPLAGSLPTPSSTDARRVEFADGSHVVLLDAQARIAVEEVSPSVLAVGMPSGRARFEVVPNRARAFRVSSGEVVVEVLGTAFELLREGPRTHVSVLRGRVRVRWRAGAAELGAGETGWFPPSPAAGQPLPQATDDASPAEATAPTAKRTGSSRSWREHAEDGDFGRAYELLDRERVADDVEELLLAADAARLSGHPAQAVPFLRRVIDGHPSDPRASLASFTLGGVLMNQLGRPGEAEAAYAKARALSLGDALAQDAVARQVEAAHRAGDSARARELALEYLHKYPTGRRVNAVRRFGGLP